MLCKLPPTCAIFGAALALLAVQHIVLLLLRVVGRSFGLLIIYIIINRKIVPFVRLGRLASLANYIEMYVKWALGAA